MISFVMIKKKKKRIKFDRKFASALTFLDHTVCVLVFVHLETM